MIDLKNVIGLIEIIYLKKVSCIVRKKTGDDRKWLVVFEGETEWEIIKLSDEEVNKVNMFYEMRMYIDSVVKE